MARKTGKKWTAGILTFSFVVVCGLGPVPKAAAREDGNTPAAAAEAALSVLEAAAGQTALVTALAGDDASTSSGDSAGKAAAVQAVSAFVRDARAYAGRALGNPDYTEDYYESLRSKVRESGPDFPAVREGALRLIDRAEADGAAVRALRETVLNQYQEEIRAGAVNPGTAMAWGMVRAGIGMPDAVFAPDSLTFSETAASLSITHGGVPVSISLAADNSGSLFRAEVDGYNFAAAWAVLFQQPLSWMLAAARELRAAGLEPQEYPDWTVMEAPEGLIALRSSSGGKDAAAFPDQAFFRGELRTVTALPVSRDPEALNSQFIEAARTLHEGIMGDDSISRPLRQALHPVLEGTYRPVDPRDYFDGDFCRRIIEADYLEAHISPFPPERAAELARYREALARLEAGQDRFAVDLGGNGRLVAVMRLDPADTVEDEETAASDAEEILAGYEWRLEEAEYTTFYSELPERYLYALSLAERYPGRHAVRPEGVPELTEVWHAVLGRIGGYRDGEDAAFGSEEAWLSAVTLDCRGRLDTTSGPLGWNFPFHVLQRDGEGDPVRLATLRGTVESPYFSAGGDPETLRREEDAWLDHAAAVLQEPGELGLIFHHFFRYCSDSPLPEMPNLIGSHYGLSDTHQTVYESLERRWAGRLIGDCDDLAEFFQVLTARQGKLSHVMQVPSHAAAAYAEQTEDGEYRFVVLQTGPVLQFTAPTLYGAVEAGYRSFDSDRGTSRITAAAVPILLRFEDEETRTPFVLSARIYEDPDYAETMIRVQSYWHKSVFSAAIAEMEELTAHDRETGNLKELAGLCEQVGRYDDSERLRLEELEAADGDPLSQLSTLLDIAQLRVKDKNFSGALEILGRMEMLFLDLHAESSPEFAKALPFRSYCAMLLARLDEPVRAWQLMALDLGLSGGRPPEHILRTLTAVYERMTMADAAGPAVRQARSQLELLLDTAFGAGFFRRDDSNNRILSRYHLLGRYALAAEGRAEAVRLLTWDGPYPEGPREHWTRRRALSGSDWEWLRIVPGFLLGVGLEMLDADDLPELYDPEGARPVLEAVARAAEKGEDLGADLAGGDALTRSGLVLSFLNNDLAAFADIMAEVREKNYAGLYDDAAVTFGTYGGLVPAGDFGKWIETFRNAFPGKQHYFKAAYRALDKEYFEHAVMLARATAGYFPEDPLMTQEADSLIEAAASMRERRRERETEESRAEGAAPGTGEEICCLDIPFWRLPAA